MQTDRSRMTRWERWNTPTLGSAWVNGFMIGFTLGGAIVLCLCTLRGIL